MGYSPDIFRSYDIRGVVPDELDADTAEKIGRAFVVYTGAKKIVVGNDMRSTSPELKEALIKGVIAQGANVIDISMVSTPLFYYSVWQAEADGGIMVTASHNPGEFNGFKMTRAQAVPISKDTGLLDIKKLVEKDAFTPAENKGEVSTTDYSDEYVEYAAAGTEKIGPLSVVIDAGNGMGGLLLPRAIEKMRQVRAVEMYFEPDGSFPHHEANPLKEENMEDLRERVLNERANLGVAFDGDGDRVGFIDEKGNTVPGDIITALIAKEMLKGKSGKVLYDLRSSKAVKEVIEEAGGEPIMSRVGHSYIKEQMRKENAIFAGELSGHFYFADYYAESAIRAMVILMQLITKEGNPLSVIAQPLKKYSKTSEINFTVEDKEAKIAKVKQKYADGNQLELDGLSVEYPDWWFNLRASGTEPLLRLNMEAETPELLAEKKEELFAVLGQPS